MKSSNQAEVQQAFTRQASGFESERMSFSRADYLSYTVSRIAPVKTDAVLEVAAGTCACGRAIAPYVAGVVCLDMTPAMLAVGRAEAEKAGLDNMTFVLGDAAELPLPDGGFDVVLSRLAFHHFPDTEHPFAEMVRVLRPDGRLVLIDMEAAETPLRETEDRIEQMRDASHVRNLSRAEMRALYERHGLRVECCEAAHIPVDLQSWMELTQTPYPAQKKIRALLAAETAGGERKGFAPYLDGDHIKFDQRWLLLIGKRK